MSRTVKKGKVGKGKKGFRPPSGQGMNLAKRNLESSSDQFEPTEASPIRQRARMAGVS